MYIAHTTNDDNILYACVVYYYSNSIFIWRCYVCMLVCQFFFDGALVFTKFSAEMCWKFDLLFCVNLCVELCNEIYVSEWIFRHILATQMMIIQRWCEANVEVKWRFCVYTIFACLSVWTKECCFEFSNCFTNAMWQYAERKKKEIHVFVVAQLSLDDWKQKQCTYLQSFVFICWHLPVSVVSFGIWNICVRDRTFYFSR